MNIPHFKIAFIAGAIFFIAPTTSSAQTNDFQSQYENFKKQAKAEYEDFRAQCNAEYVEFVKEAWKEYKALPAIPRPKDEIVFPVIRPNKDKGKKMEDKAITIKDIVSPIEQAPQPKPITPIYEKEQQAENKCQFIYCGTDCSVRFPSDIYIDLDVCDNQHIAEAWKKLSTDQLDNTIRDFLEIRIRMQLCDWAYLNLIDTFAKDHFGIGNLATLTTAYIYSQSGYQMRVGRNGNKLYLLFGSKHGIYDKGYFLIDGIHYYSLSNDTQKMEVCYFAFPKEQSLSLYMPQSQLFTYQPTPIRNLSSDRYKDMTLNVQVNKNLIDFYNTYPTSEVNGNFMTRWAMYANTPMEQEVQKQLYPILQEKIAGLNEHDAVNKLLNWVQTAFVYDYDDKVWGHDRAFFAEETLFYLYCDCEDRAILFTRIVRDLLGLKSILIYYPGHLASAVCFNQQVTGDYILLSGNKFVVCDPTYIGAPVGLTMPNMDNKSANVIILE